ncbi:amidohydrolase family protein [Amycolatopsis orientalis]|uniref:amidohydrolase family protein n=1 Tax=Amycolatopsis orientalis TaxID=31958 RepID=UPI0003A9090B|nr:amidohydrolase family protein [Amycolatopsis orientalis]
MRTLLRNGTVVSLDPAVGDLRRGDVLIEDGRIAAVGPAIDADAEIVDATGKIVLPGFVDTHRHTWQTAFRGLGADWTFDEYRAAMHGTLRPHYRPEDVYLGNLLGRLEALNSGVTTMLDWFHCSDRPENADAAIDALQEAPGRSVFCYCAAEPSDVTRVRKRLPGDEMAFGLRGPMLTTMDTTAADVALARELGLRVSVHVHGAACASLPEMHERKLLDDRTTIVHGNGLTDAQLAIIAEAGCSVTISPDVEAKMGFGWPETGRLLAAGIRPSLSIDDCPSAGGDMFSAMRTAFAVQRGLDGSLVARDLLELATVDGARACGRGDRAGSISVGKDADLVLIDADELSVFPVNDPVSTVVTAGHPGVVDSVFVGGTAVKRDGRLLGVELPKLRARLLESRDRIAAAAGLALG